MHRDDEDGAVLASPDEILTEAGLEPEDAPVSADLHNVQDMHDARDLEHSENVENVSQLADVLPHIDHTASEMPHKHAQEVLDDSVVTPLEAAAAASVSDDMSSSQAELFETSEGVDDADLKPSINELVADLEALIFASGTTALSMPEIRRVFGRLWGEDDLERRAVLLKRLDKAYALLWERWDRSDKALGFDLVQVGEGVCFRTHPRHSQVLQAWMDRKPPKLSRPALETLAIIAYRQPTTKVEVDDIRGVDSAGTVRMLVERDLVRIVGKADEPGRPLLYGTTRGFLTFFNLSNLNHLPSLRQFHELDDNSQTHLASFDKKNGGLRSLAESAPSLGFEEEGPLADLEQAVAGLKDAAASSEEALNEAGYGSDEEGEETEEPKRAAS